MPTYRYVCDECTFEHEVHCKIEERDDHQGTCPSCSKGIMKKVIGNNGGFRLLEGGAVSWGDGGYNTIYGDIENFKAGRKVYD
jgi:putative FmdB family regulatory protein